MPRLSSYPNPSVPTPLLLLYRSTPNAPPLSTLLALAMRQWLLEVAGVPESSLPAPPAPTRTTAATQARSARRSRSV